MSKKEIFGLDIDHVPWDYSKSAEENIEMQNKKFEEVYGIKPMGLDELNEIEEKERD